MLKTLMLVVVALLWQQGVLSIEEHCKECICANSGGRTGSAGNCSMPAKGTCLNGVYCGPYGMSIQYWIDAGSPSGNFYDCMNDWECSNKTLEVYGTKYCQTQFVGHAPPCSCEEQARIHHCGPYSIHAQFCDSYWFGYMQPCIGS
ncbi:invertebrate-type lysozyme-like [Pollicipes pollicipes]|uniref:invertebrate-type lysozyme-like n=1 Tax=Pollicipes pollicipes TaxID=41117 RepID=UPI0018851543|nr:invertebrate-type lysozyme-like [Pollicipes pollicipes]XP_037090288.1 invertebrate-type lysozyme-like [Pollicipes pollicipes]